MFLIINDIVGLLYGIETKIIACAVAIIITALMFLWLDSSLNIHNLEMKLTQGGFKSNDVEKLNKNIYRLYYLEIISGLVVAGAFAALIAIGVYYGSTDRISF